MKDKPLKIVLPKDPFKIGETRDGQPIWMDPKDLIQTPDEKLWQLENVACQERFQVVDGIAQAVLMNAQVFMQQTFMATACETGARLMVHGSPEDASDWINKAGYEMIQDGLTSVVKCKGKELRQMTATVPKTFEGEVIRRITQLIAQAE